MLVYHPYRFDGRVETALRGGLCLCWGVTIDQTTSELTASISTAAPSRTRRQDQGVPPALTGSASRFRLQGECPSGDLRLRPVCARRSGLVHVCHRHDHVARAAGSFYGYSVHVPHREQRACCRRLRVPALPAGLLLSPRQAPPSRPYPTRLRTQPRIAPGDPMATARQGTAATATFALGPCLEAASDSLLSQRCTTVYTLASSPAFGTGSYAALLLFPTVQSTEGSV